MRPIRVITQKNIVIQSYLWLALPSFIWAIGWLRPIFSIPLTLFSASIIIQILRQPKETFRMKDFQDVRITKKYYGILLFAALFTAFTGIGGVYFQLGGDHPYRNAIFYELARNAWPVDHSVPDGSPSILCYYMGFWLPAALVVKATGYMMAGDIALYLYAFWGLKLILDFQYAWNGGKPSALTAIILFTINGLAWMWELPLSKPDFPWTSVLFGFPDYPTTYYSSAWPITAYFCVFNQTIPAFVGMCLLYHTRNNLKNLPFTYSLLFLPSLFPAMGLAPIMAAYLIHNIRKVIGWELIPALLLMFTEGCYFAGNNNSSLFSPEIISVTDIISTGLIISLLDFCIYLPWIWHRIKHDKLFWAFFTIMLLMPALSFGNSQDMGWRMGVPFYLYFITVIIRCVHEARHGQDSLSTGFKEKGGIFKPKVFAMALAIGSSISLICYSGHIIRPIAILSGNPLPSDKYRTSSRLPRKEDWLSGHLHDRNYHGLYDNFFADGDTFFTRHMIRE